MRRHTGRESARLARALDATASTRTRDTAVDELVSLTEKLSRIDLDLDGRPDPVFRAETRQRMLALAEQRAATDRGATHRAPAEPRLHLPAWGRRVAVAVAVFCAVLATAGLLTLLSRDALPGDSLYAVKRGAEQVQLSLTWDRDERGFVLLQFAETRLDEVTALVQAPVALAAGVPGTPLAAGSDSADAVVATLAEMDRQTAAGISLLTTSAVDRSDEATLEILPTWAKGQQALLGALVTEMTQSEQDRARVSLTLLEQVEQRARLLELALPCECLDNRPGDDLGPVPCESCQPVPGGRPGGSPTPTPPGPGAGPTGSPTQPVPSPTRISPTS
ncbi:MAG: DUF5667 domain-containing protein [Actinomycetota bacterium]|nr:DUF5667 domain-containing protein [Actinomycetota bacterium]